MDYSNLVIPFAGLFASLTLLFIYLIIKSVAKANKEQQPNTEHIMLKDVDYNIDDVVTVILNKRKHNIIIKEKVNHLVRYTYMDTKVEVDLNGYLDPTEVVCLKHYPINK